jgi:hypothetical protein
MAIRNPYSEFSRRGDEVDERQALLDALDEPQPPPMQARPRTPTRTPEQTREMLSSPGGRTQSFLDPREAAEIGRNAYTGTPNQDVDTPPVYTPPSTTSTQPPAGSESPSNMSRGYQLMDEYDDPYTRRNEGAGGALSNGARWAQTGATVGSVVPGVGTLVGGVVGGLAGLIGGAFTKNAESAMTDFSVDDARAIISAAHKDAFGRDITPEYLDEILQGQGWRPGHEWFGERPLAYVLDQFAQQAPADRAATAAANAAAANQGSAAAPAGASPGGTGGGLPFSGFDLNRAQDPTKSAKDAFAALAQQAPPMTDTSKAGAEAWFREHIAPGMEAAGYKIYDLQGDKAWVGSREDPEGRVPVDWLINAGGSNVQIGWQPESGGGAGGGGTAGDAQQAYANLSSRISPNASREEMEAAIEAEFGHLPGYGGAYKESVMLNGQWYDMVTGYGADGASWGGLTPKGDGPSAGAGNASASPSNTGLNLAPGVQLAGPLGQSDINQRIQEELQRILSGAPPRDELLEALG